jgi:hypothetical protein
LGSFGIAGLEKFSPTAVKQAETTKEEEKKEELDPYA